MGHNLDYLTSPIQFKKLSGKIVATLLLFCLVAPACVTYSWLQYRKAVVRKEVKRRMKAGLKPSELVLLKFTKSESQTKLHWEHAKEFEFAGQMYDIIETEIKGDSIFYHCWWDHAETMLNKQLKNLLADALEKDPKNSESQKRLLHFYKSLYFANIPVNQVFVSIFPKKQKICTYTFFLPSRCFPPPTPPPQAS